MTSRSLPLLALALAACGPGLQAEPCTCEAGHGVQICDGGDCQPCACLAYAEPTADPDPETTFWVAPGATGDGTRDDPWGAVDWDRVDSALVDGHVHVRFTTTGTWEDRLDVRRTDDGPHRLVLDGSAWPAGGGRATLPGIHTGYDDVARHRVTVRGFEVTGSRDKGVYWRAGDGIVLEDLVVHHNRGSPAINLEYANRTGLPSTGFAVRNNHVYDQDGECIYIGGAEGTGEPSHADVVIEHNLVHHCWNAWDSKHDGINVKDGIDGVLVNGNVVFATDWGIEAGSPGVYSTNLVFATARNGFHFSDVWGDGLDGLVLQDAVVLGAGEHGIRLGADVSDAQGITLSGVTVIAAKEAGIAFAGQAGITGTAEDIVLVDNGVGLDGWGDVAIDMGACATRDNGEDDARSAHDLTSACDTASAPGDLANPAGPDGVFLTPDDPGR